MLRRLSSLISSRAVTIVAVLALISAFVFVAHPVFAQDAFSQFGQATDLAQDSLPIIIARLIRAVLGILGILVVVIIIYAGVLYMTAAGDERKVEQAKLVLRNAVIGLVLIFSSFAIAQFVLNSLLRASSATGGITSRNASAFIEPLSGSLGAGIVQDHFPSRGALEVPRNTKIFVTFKQAIDPASIIDGFSDNPESIALDTRAVKIYPTEAGVGSALTGDQVAVTVSEDHRTFVFDPVPLLGSVDTDTNYSVDLTSAISLENGRNAFTGAFNNGYSWTFEVSTEADTTPPHVVSVLPVSRGTHAPNSVIQLTFSEPMDPVSSTGVQNTAATPPQIFDAIEVFRGSVSARNVVNGTYAITNGYRTIEFVSDEPCAQDACGTTVFCLPIDSDINVVARSATLSDAPPQARLFGARFDGLADAAGNSLDGNNDGTVTEGDDYDDLSFRTSGTVDDRTPTIISLEPTINNGEVPVDADVAVTFSMPMSVSSLSSTNVQLWNEPSYEMFFLPRSSLLTDTQRPAGCADTVGCTRTQILHPTFLPADVTGGPFSYYPLVSEGVKGANQFCMFPALGPSESGAASCGTTASAPFCCNGRPQSTVCTTQEGTELPPTP